MTINEVSKKFNIPIDFLKEYENMELCIVDRKIIGHWNYDEKDMEQISFIMILRDSGFTYEEVKRYMHIKLLGYEYSSECLKMLNEKRNVKLKEIHCCEKQLENMDFLRYEIQKNIN